jgi:hypothetical protein
MTIVVLIKTSQGYSVMPLQEYDGETRFVLREYDPFQRWGAVAGVPLAATAHTHFWGWPCHPLGMSPFRHPVQSLPHRRDRIWAATNSIFQDLRKNFCGAIRHIESNSLQWANPAIAGQQQSHRRTWPAIGAWAFPCPPDIPANARPASWSPAACPFTVILEPAPQGFAHADILEISRWPIILADRRLSGGRHIILADTDGPHHIWLTAATPAQPLAYVIARDAHSALRYAAAARLDRRLRGAPPARKAHINRPTSYQQHRLRLLLAILDLLGTDDNKRATTFQICRTLVYPHRKFENSAEWKSSNERRRTQRLVEEAVQLMQSGYRSLLHGVASVRQK